ncbi:MAG TPA: DUF3788 family protein [Spirochaetota bacterium]|nr:DUF3788 family protein [Spirochaetota bacterium]
MEEQFLINEHIFPDEKTLKETTGDLYPLYEEIINTITDNTFNLTVEWRYYKDGKSWLCKATYKKKTVFWFSVWEDYFKVSFYFTEKTEKKVYELDIDCRLKEEFRGSKIIGKLKPLIININDKSQIKDLLKIIEYKKNLK